VRQSVFADNMGISGSMAVQAVDAAVAIGSTTFVNNRAMLPATGAQPLNEGASLSCYGSSTCTFNNSISWDGDTSNNNTQRLHRDATASLAASFSDILGGSWAGNNSNIEAEPLLDACFTAAAGSPVINAGDPAYAGPDAIDFLGNPRLQGGRLDMGAVEVQPDSSVVGDDGAGAGAGAGAGGGGGGSSGGGAANRAPMLAPGFTPAISLGANQVSNRSCTWDTGDVKALGCVLAHQRRTSSDTCPWLDSQGGGLPPACMFFYQLAHARTYPTRTQLLALNWADIFTDPDGDAFAVLEGGPSGLASSGVLAVGSAALAILKFTPVFGSTNAKFSIKATDLKGAESPTTQVSLLFGEQLLGGR
jgi:hypothetical protein